MKKQSKSTVSHPTRILDGGTLAQVTGGDITAAVDAHTGQRLAIAPRDASTGLSSGIISPRDTNSGLPTGIVSPRDPASGQ